VSNLDLVSGRACGRSYLADRPLVLLFISLSMNPTVGLFGYKICLTDYGNFSFICKYYIDATHVVNVANGGCQYDLKNERMFLRRVKVNDVRLCDLRVGAYVNVLSRRLRIVDYARTSTQQYFTHEKERYFSSRP